MLILNYLDRTSKHAFLSAIIWLMLGIALGLWEALLLAFPEINEMLPTFLLQFVEFGKLRQVHVNILTFAWISLALLGSLFYMIPRLAQKPLYSEKLGVIAVHIWNGSILIGVIGLILGYSRAREYASLFWPSDALWLIAFLLINITVWKTMLERKQKMLAAPVWYLLGSIVWMPLIIILGKGLWANFFTNPFIGTFDNVANWFLGHNILGLWFTTLGIGVAYYIVPRASHTRIYSHYLSIIGFWTLVLFYPAVGAHHTLAGPIPSWLMSEATVFSILMVIPVFTAVYNIFKTSKINSGLIHEKMILRFILVGVALYAFVSLQGSFQALRFVSKYLHFTQWVPGHAMLAIGGGFTLIAFGGFYYCYPRIIGRYMKSPKLISWHFWLTLIGISSIFLGLTISGLIQASNWTNTIAGMHWIDATVRAVKPEIYFTALGGGVYIAGQIVFLVNLFQTGFKKEVTETVYFNILDDHPEYSPEQEELRSV